MRIVRRSPVPFLMALCCQAGLTDLATAASSWTNPGPDGGGVTAIAIDPVHPDTLYAGTWTAGTWKSIDGGSDWTHASTGLPSSDVRDLALDPRTPTTVWAATGGGIAKSVDGGQSWL